MGTARVAPASNPEFRVGFSGSRTWTNRLMVLSVIQELAERRPGCTVVVGCAQGLDKIVRDLAPKYGLKLEVHQAKWREFGKRAGMLRNESMVRSGLNSLVAFRIGGDASRGTTHMIRLCQSQGIKTRVFDK